MMSSPTDIQAIVFDAYGTLLDVQSLTNKLTSYFPEHATEINNIWRRKQLEYTWLRSLMEQYKPFSEVTAEALEFACKAAQVPLPTEVKADLVSGYFSLKAYPEIADSLQELSKHYQLAILSNADPAMLEAATSTNNLNEHLQAIISADSVQTFKPHPSVYRLAEHELKLDRAHIAFVSSNTWDVSGAKSFGLYSIWLQRGQLPMEVLGFEPDISINKITDLFMLQNANE